MFSQLEGNELFIGPGLGYNPDIEHSYKKSKIIEDYWKFDLIEKEWFKLGDGTSYLKNENLIIVSSFLKKYPESKYLNEIKQWRNKLAYNEPFVDYYFRHPAYQDYPVVGISWKQANDFSAWRTDRVNEMILDREGVVNFDVMLDASGDNNMNTRAYLANQYEFTKVNSTKKLFRKN